MTMHTGMKAIRLAAEQYLDGLLTAHEFRTKVAIEILDDGGMDMDESGETIELARVLSCTQ